MFVHRENEEILLPDGRRVWLSRSVVVVMVALVRCGGELYVAMGERGPAADGGQGLWCMPCGYLDWDEDGGHGARRESWEEIGLDIAGLGNVIASRLDHPWHVGTRPAGERQNVSLSYGVYCELDQLPPLTLGHIPGETSASAWRPLSWLEANRTSVAYTHDIKARQFAQLVGAC